MNVVNKPSLGFLCCGGLLIIVCTAQSWLFVCSLKLFCLYWIFLTPRACPQLIPHRCYTGRTDPVREWAEAERERRGQPRVRPFLYLLLT